MPLRGLWTFLPATGGCATLHPRLFNLCRYAACGRCCSRPGVALRSAPGYSIYAATRLADVLACNRGLRYAPPPAIQFVPLRGLWTFLLATGGCATLHPRLFNLCRYAACGRSCLQPGVALRSLTPPAIQFVPLRGLWTFLPATGGCAALHPRLFNLCRYAACGRSCSRLFGLRRPAAVCRTVRIPAIASGITATAAAERHMHVKPDRRMERALHVGHSQ